MTNLKASRKGTRLNEARYFRLPLPHTRKRMTLIRVISQDSESDRFHMVQGAKSPNLRFRTARDSGKMIESKQSSVEIALVTCYGFENFDQEVRTREGCRDICLETEIIEPSSDPPSSTQQEHIPTIIRNNSGKSTEFPQEDVDDQCRQIVREIARNEKLRNHVKRSCESVDRKQNCGDRIVETKRKEERCSSSWWKDGGQTILHFFAKILGKRVGMDPKGTVDRVSPIGKRVKRVSRDGKNHNGHRRGIDGGVRLKRVNDGYIVPSHIYRNERSRYGGAMAKDESREEQHRPSILVRQIQRTRDKNLRMMLLERELRVRSPKRSGRFTANSINIRQLSNPLC